MGKNGLHRWSSEHMSDLKIPGVTAKHEVCEDCGVRKFTDRDAAYRVRRKYVLLDGKITHLRPICTNENLTPNVPVDLTPQNPATVKTTGATAEELATLFKAEMDKNSVNPADVIGLIRVAYSSEIEVELEELNARKAVLIALRHRLQQ